jgi:polyhydroxyalkanoate synthase
MSVKGVPIDLTKIETPAYIQAGKEDHIAPAPSVWKLTKTLSGPKRFVLAGSGHIAGVVNPPAANKYQYWTSDEQASTLDEFVSEATEHPGSWWPDWLEWLKSLDASMVKAEGARIPGEGKLKAIEDAPGRYVRTR